MEVTAASPRWSHPMGSPPGVGQPTGSQNTLVSPARPLPPLALIRFPLLNKKKKIINNHKARLHELLQSCEHLRAPCSCAGDVHATIPAPQGPSTHRRMMK